MAGVMEDWFLRKLNIPKPDFERFRILASRAEITYLISYTVSETVFS